MSLRQFLLRPLLGNLFFVSLFEFALFHSPAPVLHFNSGLVGTLALHVHSTTLVAKLEFALTGHVIASLVLLHPKFALGTLLEFLALDKGHEFLVVLRGSRTDLVLLTRHILMPLHPTIKTVLFFALQTFESLYVILLVEEHVAAVGSRAPRNRVTMLLSIGLQGVLLILLHQLL